MDPCCVSPMGLLMPLNRRMCDRDKLIDPFCGNKNGLITGNAVQLAHGRSLTCSHNNKPYLVMPVFPPLLIFFFFDIISCTVSASPLSPIEWKSMLSILPSLKTTFPCFLTFYSVARFACVQTCVALRVYSCRMYGLTWASTLLIFLVCSAV